MVEDRGERRGGGDRERWVGGREGKTKKKKKKEVRDSTGKKSKLRGLERASGSILSLLICSDI